jgi:hypothetical protein
MSIPRSKLAAIGRNADAMHRANVAKERMDEMLWLLCTGLLVALEKIKQVNLMIVTRSDEEITVT